MTKKRNKYLSALLSLLIFGLGLFYNGKLKLALIMTVVYFTLLFIVSYFTYYLGNIFYFVTVTIFILFYISVIYTSYLEAKRNQFYSLKWYNKWYYYVLYILSFYLISLFFTSFWFQNFRIPAASMANTIYIGDYVVSNKLSTNKHERGEIVIFRYPHNIKQHFVKRCVATPGDELFLLNKDLFIHFKEGDEWIKQKYIGYETKVYAGKTWVKNPYMHKHPGIHHDDKIVNLGYPNMQPLFNLSIIQVPENEYFMMGDNRDHSNDSRFWGTVPYKNIEGTPWFIYFSIDEIGEIRWNRIGKTTAKLESLSLLKQALEAKKVHNKDNHGIY